MSKTLLSIALIFSLSFLSMEAKNPKENDSMSFEEWVEVQKKSMPEVVDGVKMFRPDYDGTNLTISDIYETTFPADTLFVKTAIWLIENMNKDTDEFAALDFDGHRLILRRKKAAMDNSANSFNYDLALQAGDNMISFYAYDIKANYKLKGLIPKTSAIEKLKPQEKDSDKALIEEFSWINSNLLQDLFEGIEKTPTLNVTHWKEIKKGEVVKGMNYTEVKLSLGQPFSEREAGNNKIKWIFDDNTVVIFTDGEVINIIR